MTSETTANLIEAEFSRMENRIDELVHHCGRLREENRLLQARNRDLEAEKEALMNKTDQVEDRIMSMMERLRTLEQTL